MNTQNDILELTANDETIYRYYWNDGDYHLLDVISYYDTEDEYITNVSKLSPYTVKDAYVVLRDFQQKFYSDY